MSEGMPKMEANVPEDKREVFEEAASTGGWARNLAQSQEHEKEVYENQSKRNKTVAGATAGAAAISAAIGHIPFAVANAAISAGTFLSGKKYDRMSKEAAKQAPISAKKAAKAYGESRAIVEEGMVDTGAERSETGELIATRKQKNAAQKEMEDKFEERRKFEKEIEREY